MSRDDGQGNEPIRRWIDPEWRRALVNHVLGRGVVWIVGAAILALGGAWLFNDRAPAQAPDAKEAIDTERADVRIAESSLFIEHDDRRKLTATGVRLRARNLGRRPALDVYVRLWLGYGGKPNTTVPPQISARVANVLDPGPDDPKRDVWVYLSGAFDVRRRGPGTYISAPVRFPAFVPPGTPVVAAPVLPPLGAVYLEGTLTFKDSLTRTEFTETPCFRHSSGWHVGSFSDEGLVQSQLERCE